MERILKTALRSCVETDNHTITTVVQYADGYKPDRKAIVCGKEELATTLKIRQQITTGTFRHAIAAGQNFLHGPPSHQCEVHLCKYPGPAELGQNSTPTIVIGNANVESFSQNGGDGINRQRFGITCW